MAYTIAEGAFALAQLRRTDLLTDHNKKETGYENAPQCVSVISFD